MSFVINYIIPLWSNFFDGGLFDYVLAPIVALAFVATVPVIIRYFIMGR